ncbi:HNH endonuclease [Priestia koreensis]|uniref:HNH endonuclease n=1 Tax=Priestia koreensis TaxID=284581 RepID=UPI0020407B5B|nr:HNH endonuclease [Priestia koreensis]MCM3003661.1 HNH endonuclease [Priestia koreensis]
MYKIEWTDKMEELLGSYHTFILEVLDFVKQEPLFLEKKDSDMDEILKRIKELKSDKNCTYNFLNIATKTNLKEYICNLKYENIDLLSKYNEIVTNYENFLSYTWQDNTKYSNEVKQAFEYFYKDLINSEVFNKTFNTISALKEFRDELTLRSTCPYCDHNEMEFDSASVDHFIPKSQYPLLSIFPKNLVVSCTACNDRIKKEKLHLPIMHPYFNNLDDYFYFTYKNKVINIEFYDYVSLENQKKVNNFLKLFKLEYRYNKYCKEKLDRLKSGIQRNVIKQIKGVQNISTDEIENRVKEEIYDLYVEISKYKKQDALTKLRLDYLKQLSKEDLSDLIMYIDYENRDNILSAFSAALK